jgi:hypothetical protein
MAKTKSSSSSNHKINFGTRKKVKREKSTINMIEKRENIEDRVDNQPF